MKPGEKLYTWIRWVQRRRRGHGRPEKEPAGSPLKKTVQIHVPSKVDRVEENTQEYDAPQRIEEDWSLVITEEVGGLA